MVAVSSCILWTSLPDLFTRAFISWSGIDLQAVIIQEEALSCRVTDYSSGTLSTRIRFRPCYYYWVKYKIEGVESTNKLNEKFLNARRVGSTIRIIADKNGKLPPVLAGAAYETLNLGISICSVFLQLILFLCCAVAGWGIAKDLIWISRIKKAGVLARAKLETAIIENKSEGKSSSESDDEQKVTLKFTWRHPRTGVDRSYESETLTLPISEMGLIVPGIVLEFKHLPDYDRPVLVTFGKSLVLAR